MSGWGRLDKRGSIPVAGALNNGSGPADTWGMHVERTFRSSAMNGADLAVVQPQLAAGEQVEWIGRPDPTKRFTRGDVFLVPFSIMWGGFAIFWESAAIAGGSGVFFELWGIPFVVIGLYFIAGRFFYKAYRKRRTIYAVTNRRVLCIVRRRRGEAVDASYLSALPNVSTTVGPDGRGSVTFGTPSAVGGMYGNTGMELFTRAAVAGAGVSFFDIEDPRAVADLVERLREAERSR